jgi:hypothetical protein
MKGNVYANEDKIVQYFYINNRVLKSQTVEEVRMKDEAHIECFNLLNFFSSRDLEEVDCQNIYVHFELGPADAELFG